MTPSALSTIAQVLFESTSSLNYARIVTEMKQVLTRLKPDQLSITWDCEDLVFFDLAETRIALGFAEFTEGRISSCLSVSVGPRPGVPSSADAGYDVLCSRIVERLQTRYLPMAVLWHQCDGEIDADLIDGLTEQLPAPEKFLPPIEGLIDPLWAAASEAEAARGTTRMIGRFPEPPQRSAAHTANKKARSQPAAEPVHLLPRKVALAANDMQPGVIPRSAELARLRDALYPGDPAQPPAEVDKISTQMRLAVHAMNATLILVWLPLGATVMTYSLLRGENMRLSGRVMALTGTFLAFAHSPFGQTVAAAVAGTLS